VTPPKAITAVPVTAPLVTARHTDALTDPTVTDPCDTHVKPVVVIPETTLGSVVLKFVMNARMIEFAGYVTEAVV
jgi:hypothetical protein